MKTNLTIATLIVVILTAWMVFGSIGANDEAAQKAEAVQAVEATEKPLPSVRVRDSIAQEFAAKVTLRGKTLASRESVLKAEIGGQILEIVAQRGSAVKAGDPLIKIDPQNLPEQIEAAEAVLQQRQLEYDAAQKLRSSGYQSETRLAETAAALANAQSTLAATRIALEHTVVSAPYDGVFNDRLVEEGEFVAIGDPMAHFLALNPMIVTAEATEQEIQKINADSPAVAKIGDKTVEGHIRYLSKSANSAVRTYTVELEFENPNLSFEAGMTADIVATTATQMAHKVTPAILFLSADTDGELGLKTIDDENEVSFHKTKIIGTADDGVWVSGLPEKVKLITVGQGFVVPGATVNAVEESSIQ
ncbi:efflux RND transporter periplasmic adaptor subunit [Pelagicoccus sp. SDUM812002]|uniref:efflux RND transporter periplasmic adaptor subunit n=1 Tax=Pelagicoccus sp. SDUM812002 TaxID=3041266 RepID=UPI00280E2012|nr:efflux RND transporter periplasmic adaptor subunit [Pelagicoccus sp. SDUM812002]MDQ8187447.1 efflux RND transporter periplasmic adaptor subunit [Pelagicoccus sp. SDUM812002]